jgi:hypothetical protein
MSFWSTLLLKPKSLTTAELHPDAESEKLGVSALEDGCPAPGIQITAEVAQITSL